jgi:hypothetical protein
MHASNQFDVIRFVNRFDTDTYQQLIWNRFRLITSGFDILTNALEPKPLVPKIFQNWYR